MQIVAALDLNAPTDLDTLIKWERVGSSSVALTLGHLSDDTAVVVFSIRDNAVGDEIAAAAMSAYRRQVQPLKASVELKFPMIGHRFRTIRRLRDDLPVGTSGTIIYVDAVTIQMRFDNIFSSDLTYTWKQGLPVGELVPSHVILDFCCDCESDVPFEASSDGS